MKFRKTFFRRLVLLILIQVMVQPQYVMAATSYVSGFNSAADTTQSASGVIAADDSVTVIVDYDKNDNGSFVVSDWNGSSSPISVIVSDAQSTIISATTSGGSTVTNSLTVSGSGTTNSGNFSVTGATTLASTLGISGATTLGSTLGVTGATTLSSTLDVTGATTLGGNLTANGTANTIGTAGSSTNTITGATNQITGETTITSADGSHVASVTGSNIHLSGGNTGLTITGDTEDTTANTIVMIADSDDSSANARSGLSMDSTSVSLLVNTDAGESHGIEITQTSTIISGGTNSTTLTLDDDGATFADTATSGPARVMGVANGVNNYDAVNMGQFRREVSRLDDRIDKSYAGIASVAALAAIPSPVEGNNMSVGLGYGSFESQNALAVGVKALVGIERNITLAAGVGYCNSSTTISAGLGWSF